MLDNTIWHVIAGVITWIVVSAVVIALFCRLIWASEDEDEEK